MTTAPPPHLAPHEQIHAWVCRSCAAELGQCTLLCLRIGQVVVRWVVTVECKACGHEQVWRPGGQGR
jgi:hypothetical protein